MSSDHHAELRVAAELIAANDKFLLIGHQNPDGDALGSALAMKHLLEANGKRAIVSWPQPFADAWTNYSTLPGIDGCVAPESISEQPDIVITFDCASLGRIGELTDFVDRAGTLIVVDHHYSNESFGDINVIDVEAAATAVVVRELANALGWPLNRDAAYCLYVGLVTDTGRFAFSSTTSAVFSLASELATFDLPIAEITRELFDETRLPVLRLTAEVISRAELDNELQLISSWVTQDDLDVFAVARPELDGLIEVLRRTAEAEVACVLREFDGQTHGSLRSVSRVDVSAIARSLGGGGHKLAAGFSSDLSRDAVLSQIKRELSAAHT